MRLFVLFVTVAALLGLNACASEASLRRAFDATHPTPPPTISSSPSRGSGDSVGYSYAAFSSQDLLDMSHGTRSRASGDVLQP